MIRELSDFRWPEPLKMDSTKRDHNRKCVYHKEHEHAMEQCKSLHYLVEKLIKDGHLKQYFRSGVKSGETSQNPAIASPTTFVAPRFMTNYIHGGLLDKEYRSKRKTQRLLRSTSIQEQVSSIRPRLTSGSAHQIDGIITFSPVDLNRILQPHRAALILKLGISDFDVR